MRSWITLLILGTIACGGSSAPSAPTPAPATYTISGQLTATNGGQPLSAALDFGIASTTSQNGAFTVSVPTTAPTLTLTISGAGLVSRRTYVQPGTRTVNLDAIAESGFDLNFYRQFVRNTFDAPGLADALRRWTRPPSVYIQTRTDAKTLDMIEREVRAMVQVWSGGTLSVAAIERGNETRVNQAGWLTIAMDVSAAHCGLSDIGLEGGVITLAAGQPRCGCGGYSVAPTAVRHEIGHSMGFRHTGAQTDVMFPTYVECDMPPSARERYHAAIAYHRPVGNEDPDTDPFGTVNLRPLRVP